jgi:hypothetical protein
LVTIKKLRVGAEWVNTFHADACQQTDLNYCDERAKGFCNKMKDKGHTRAFLWGNDNAWERDFRHPDNGGDSHNWVDNVHFCYYANHGGNWADTMHIAFSKAMDHCLGASSDWKLGTKMLKWLVLDCCQAVLNTTSNHIVSVWGKPARGIHMVFGFVGNKSGGWWSQFVGNSFASKAAKCNTLSYAWLDVADSVGTPIAIAFGVNRSMAILRRECETINWRDIDVSSTGWLAWKWRD